MKNRSERIERLVSLALILSLSLMMLSFSSRAFGETSISTVEPSSGGVGTQVQITANLTTTNGEYSVFFDNELVANGTAFANEVVANFSVPQTYAGTHDIRLMDETTSENDTGVFFVTTSYFIGTVATQISFQEGDPVPISVNVTGGEKSASFAANVTVRAPNSATYTKVLDIATSSFGNATATATFPIDFSPVSSTNLIGSYGLSLNDTVANATFVVGLMNSTQYHRGDTVNIKAAYTQSEIVTVTISGENIPNDIANVSADLAGIASYDWTVPPFASIGSYAVRVVSANGTTIKTPPDTQNFTVPGFAVNATAKNLAGDPVSSVNVEAYEGTTLADNKTTGTTGLAFLRLEIGNYTSRAFRNGQAVSETAVVVSNDTAFDIVCNLTNLRVEVVAILNGSEVSIPEVGVLVISSGERFTTDINGVAVIRSLLPNTPYVLNVTRYSSSFNVTTISSLLINNAPVAWFDAKIFCPNFVLQVTATKADGQPLTNAVVSISEALGVPSYEEHTDANGMAVFNAPFGSYVVRVYDNNMVKLNETTVALLDNQTLNMSCSLYGLTVTVKVVDYFGQGIANMEVTLQRLGQTQAATSTGPDGTVTFYNVVGGLLNVLVTSNGASTPIAAQSVNVEDLTTLISIHVDEYVVLAGMLVQTVQLTAIILIILIVVLILFLEVYRRRRHRLQKTETSSADKES
jgi:hypothetical protein